MHRAIRPFLTEVALLAAGALCYYLVRGAVVDRVSEATANARRLMQLERSLGLSWEGAMQGWILPSQGLIDLVNAIYLWSHLPVIALVALWLYGRHRRLYRFTRNAGLGSAIVALAVYYAFPVAPPRLLSDLGFIDTMAQYSETSYQAQRLGPFVNPYAAVPSLHIGWALLIALALWLGRPPGRWRGLTFGALAVLLPLAQFFAVVMTANHFVLDAAAGALAAALGVAAASGWQRYRWARRSRPGARGGAWPYART